MGAKENEAEREERAACRRRGLMLAGRGEKEMDEESA